MKQLFILVFLAGALIASACTSTSTTCNAPDIQCGNLCVDPSLDPNNCGGCDQVCSAGFVCKPDQEQKGTCSCPAGASCGGGVGDLFAACFHAGTVVPVVRTTLTPTTPSTSMLDGPQSLAATEDGDTILALDSLDDTLFTIDRASMKVLGSTLVQSTGTSFPSQVLVRDHRAYVVKSGTNSVAVVDISDLTRPKVLNETSTGAGTGPEGAAFDGAGNLWVSLLTTGQLIEITYSGDQGTAGQPIDLPDVGGGLKFPTGVAVFGNQVYVTMNHLDSTTFAPLAPGFAAVVSTSGGTPDRLDLGNDCLNPGFVAPQGTNLWIACTGAFGSGNGEVVALDTKTNKVTTRVVTGGAPARLSAVKDHIFAADSGGPNLIDVRTGDGTFLSGKACLGGDAMEFAGDVLAF